MLTKINTVKTPNKALPKTKDKWDEVNKLWRKVEKAEAKSANFESEKNAFYEKVKNEIGELEVEYNRKMLSGLETLLKFIPYKSLSENKLDVLNAWIHNLIGHIDQNPFNIDDNFLNTTDLLRACNDKFKERFKKLNPDMEMNFVESEDNSQNAEINNLIIMLKVTLQEIYGFIPRFSKLQWLCLITDSSRIHEILTDPFFKEDPDAIEDENPDGTFIFNDEDFEQLHAIHSERQSSSFDEFCEKFSEEFSGFDFGNNESDFGSFADDDIFESNQLIKSEEINRIYRQLAHKFHPDKITNEDDKAHYSELMQKLSIAKKAKDIHVIIQMAIEYLPDFNPELSDETFASMVRSLKIRLREIDSELMDQQYDNSPQGLIWKRFYHKNQKTVKKNLNTHISYLKERISRVDDLFFTQKMTIKRLNAILTDVEYALKSY